jgi:hypothetical protein
MSGDSRRLAKQRWPLAIMRIPVAAAARCPRRSKDEIGKEECDEDEAETSIARLAWIAPKEAVAKPTAPISQSPPRS